MPQIYGIEFESIGHTWTHLGQILQNRENTCFMSCFFNVTEPDIIRFGNF